MINQKPKAVLFDWDGTLAQTRNAVVSAIEHVLKSRGKETWSVVREKYRDPNKSFKENFPNFFGGDAWKAYQEYLEYYSTHTYKNVVPAKGALELLEFLQGQGVDLYVVSNKEKSLLLREVESCYPDVEFKNILGDGAAAFNKPAPDPILFALRDADFEISRENVWMVGDSKQDTDSAVAAGALPIIIKTDFFKNDFTDRNYIKENEIILCKNFNDLLERTIKAFY